MKITDWVWQSQLSFYRSKLSNDVHNTNPRSTFSERGKRIWKDVSAQNVTPPTSSQTIKTLLSKRSSRHGSSSLCKLHIYHQPRSLLWCLQGNLSLFSRKHEFFVETFTTRLYTIFIYLWEAFFASYKNSLLG